MEDQQGTCRNTRCTSLRWFRRGHPWRRGSWKLRETRRGTIDGDHGDLPQPAAVGMVPASSASRILGDRRDFRPFCGGNPGSDSHDLQPISGYASDSATRFSRRGFARIVLTGAVLRDSIGFFSAGKRFFVGDMAAFDSERRPTTLVGIFQAAAGMRNPNRRLGCRLVRGCGDGVAAWR